MVVKSLGHHEILEPLGTGGMGDVYRARDTTPKREVAIKVLSEELSTDADRLARFEREAKLLASLNHANIATIHGLEESDVVRFIAMELVKGETLAEPLAKSGRIEVEEALEIARQIAEALEAAHENGVIHRDLKPASGHRVPSTQHMYARLKPQNGVRYFVTGAGGRDPYGFEPDSTTVNRRCNGHRFAAWILPHP